MTDLEKYIELYRSFGIELKTRSMEDENGRRYYLNFGVDTFYTEDYDTDPHFDGYPGFQTVVYFDEDGKFLRQDFVE